MEDRRSHLQGQRAGRPGDRLYLIANHRDTEGLEVFAGNIEEKFFAIPSLLFREDPEADHQYIGCGDTEEEALEDCLKKIKDVPLEVLVPPLV